jgi:threonine dehydrogenase-like Zn-dependent dehydrogenase
VQLARLSGAMKLSLIDTIAEKSELGIKLGADFTIDPSTLDVAVEAKKITD